MEEKMAIIIEKYWNQEKECYLGSRFNEETNEEIELRNELEECLKENNIPYKISCEDGFDSPGYSNEFLAIAYLDNGELKLGTIVLEYI